MVNNCCKNSRKGKEIDLYSEYTEGVAFVSVYSIIIALNVHHGLEAIQ